VSLNAGIDVLQEQIAGNYPALGQPVDELALAEIKGAILAKLRLAIGKDAGMATRRDWYKAAALALRDRVVHRWLTAEKESYDAGSKRVYYLSLEFLIGRLLSDILCNLGLADIARAALGDLGVDRGTPALGQECLDAHRSLAVHLAERDSRRPTSVLDVTWSGTVREDEGDAANDMPLPDLRRDPLLVVDPVLE
jgi:hypothetical protein